MQMFICLLSVQFFPYKKTEKVKRLLNICIRKSLLLYPVVSCFFNNILVDHWVIYCHIIHFTSKLYRKIILIHTFPTKISCFLFNIKRNMNKATEWTVMWDRKLVCPLCLVKFLIVEWSDFFNFFFFISYSKANYLDCLATKLNCTVYTNIQT